MTTKRRQDGKWMLDTARKVAERLKQEKGGTSLRIRLPTSWSVSADTKGWFAKIGDLGKARPILQIWFDEISGAVGRKLYAGFYSPSLDSIESLVEQVSRQLWPVRTVTDSDIIGEDTFSFSDKISRNEYNQPILEKYETGNSYFGIYDATRPTQDRISPHFCERAVAFFIDVARTITESGEDDPQRKIFPRYENRKHVATHKRRERSGYLAVQCKIRDEYKCQVCGLVFSERYGSLGNDFAEAHHLKPLGKQSGKVYTRLEDLITVCPNCHNMLHRMDGEPEDVKKLRAIVRRRQRK